MKIGFAGNTNNYPFALARALLRMGHQVEFVVDSGHALHRPECRYRDIHATYPAWLHDFSGVPDKYWKYLIPNKAVKNIQKIFSKCDALIVNGLWPIVAAKSGKPYVAVMTGSDLEVYADYHAMAKTQTRHLQNSSILSRPFKSIVYSQIVRQQRNAIREANGFIAAIPGLIPNADRLWRDISPRGLHLFGLMTDLADIKPVQLPNNQVPRILCAARLNWTLPMRSGTCELDYKGSDILLKGLALYLARSEVPMRLTLVRKGFDITETEALVAELGLNDAVDWLDEMSPSKLIEEYMKSDIIADQFAKSIVSVAGLDAMAMGRPLLANGRPEIMEPFIGESSPICQAANPEEVCEQLIRLSDPAERELVGQKSRAYVEKHHSTDSVAKRCLDVLEAVVR